jgi:small GTP-binding protein
MGGCLSGKGGGGFMGNKKDLRILLVGLDSAGKTTLLYQLKQNEAVNTTPTMGFNVETVAYKNLQLTIWDVGGQVKIRQLWEHYYDTVHAVIFILDANDVDRLDECKQEFKRMVNDPKLKNVPILIYANKQDLPKALKRDAIKDKLQLSQLKQKKWTVQECTATKGSGISEGLDWLAANID